MNFSRLRFTTGLIVVAAFVSACGGGAGPATKEAANPTAPTSAGNTVGSSESEGGRQRREKGRGEGKPESGTVGSNKDGTGSGSRPPKRDSGKSGRSGCPSAMTAAQCREAGKAYTRRHSHPAKAKECPPAMSARECEAAGHAYEGSQSKPVAPNQCPAAMTATQCREAGEAYAEAAK